MTARVEPAAGITSIKDYRQGDKMQGYVPQLQPTKSKHSLL